MTALQALHSTSLRPRHPVTIAALLLIVTFAGGTAAADETKLRFEPIGTYELELNGKVVPGVKMFHSPEAAAVLVMTPELPYPIAVVPRNETVQRLDPAQLQNEPQGSIAWTPKGTPVAVATFDLVEKKPVFTLDGKKIRFLDKAPLLGPVALATSLPLTYMMPVGNSEILSSTPSGSLVAGSGRP